MSEIASETLSKTPLFDLHVSLGARMVPFAGYEMPVQYPLGVLKEHLHTRAHAGLFDVSHMGQVELHGPDAAAALETLVPVDVIGIAPGKQRYALFTNEAGGILDDLMIFNVGGYLHLVVNAACKTQDIAYLKAKIGARCEVRVRDDLALLALQGPEAEALKSVAVGDIPSVFMAGSRVKLAGIDCLVTRTGYTGEDGFEISVPNAGCETLAKALLAQPNVQPIGLGARDSLRLEAGLCLYGHDLDVELQDSAGNNIGIVTSGGFGPTVNGPVIMGYVDTAHAAPGTQMNAMLRGTPTPVTVVAMPFTPHGYKR